MMLLHHSLFYVLARVIPSLVGFLTSVILTRLLIPAEFGVYGLGMSATVLVASILFDWQGLSFSRWYAKENDTPLFMQTVLTLFAATCAFSAVFLVFITTLGLLPMSTADAWLPICGSWVYAWFELSSRMRIARLEPERYLKQSLLRATLILVSVPIVAAETQSARGVLATTFVSVLLAGCLYPNNGIKSFTGRCDYRIARQLITYGWPLGLTAVSSTLAVFASRAILAGAKGTDEVGFFTAASFLIQSTIGILASGIGTPAYALAVSYIEAGEHRRADEQLAHTIVLLSAVVLPAGVGLAMFMPAVAPLLLKGSYVHPVIAMAPWMVLGQAVLYLRSNYIDLAFQLGRKTFFLAQITGLGTAINIGFCWLLIPVSGGIGACMAMAAASVVTMMLGIVTSRRVYTLPFPVGSLLRVALATGIMAGVILGLQDAKKISVFAAVPIAMTAYGAATFALDVLGIRRMALQALGSQHLGRLQVCSEQPLSDRILFRCKRRQESC